MRAVNLAKDEDLKRVVADEAVKAMGQMLEADAAKRSDRHLNSHAEEFKYCKRNHPVLFSAYQESFSIYNNLGYLGGNGEKMDRILELMKIFKKHFENEWDVELRW